MNTTPSWKDPDLTERIREKYLSYSPAKPEQRTAAIKDTFLWALQCPELRNFRPDAIWTALQNTYYLEHAGPLLREFLHKLLDRSSTSDLDNLIKELMTTESESTLDMISGINAVRNGWVRSSGTAFEQALVELYGPILKEECSIYITTRKSHVDAANRGGPLKIGTAKEDDIYLITDTQGEKFVFGIVHAKTSLGDHLYQALPRNRDLSEAGFWTVYFTLDPMEVARAQNGMLVNPHYINLIHEGPGVHTVFVGRNSDQPRQICGVSMSRIIDVSMRELHNLFVTGAARARDAWVSHKHKLPRDWYLEA